VAVVLAVASAAVYGAADFWGGLASRRASAFAVVVASQAAGLLVLLPLLPWLGGDVHLSDVGWGAAAGVVGAGGLVLFYRSLADGVMSVVAPVTAATAAAVPVLVGLLGGNRVHPWAGVGIALALVAVVLVSAEGGLSALRAARPAGLARAIVSGVAFGLFFVLLDGTSAAAGLTPLVAVRLTSIVLVAGIATAGSRSLRVPRPVLPTVLLAGVADMTANALFLLATQAGGPLAITGVLASLGPVSTVLLAQVVLGERLVPAQLAGLASAIAAVALISLPA
jgi:drug/metabolite transporter (DMT)-like permease